MPAIRNQTAAAVAVFLPVTGKLTIAAQIQDTTMVPAIC